MNMRLSVAGLPFEWGARSLLHGRHTAWATAAFVGLVSATALHADAPPLPSSRFGSVTVASTPAAAGTVVSAHFGGNTIATAAVFSDGVSRYRLDVPGDRPETPAIEGPVAGQSFEIRVAGAPAGTSLWTEGTFTPLDLGAAAGADLAVSISDGQSAVLPSQILSFTLTAQNPGTTAASGVRLFAGLPAGAVLVAASDGGTVAAGELGWPSFAMAAATSVTRSFSVRLPATFAAGIDTVATTARIAHDGAAGGDPQPTNDQASDLDELAAFPDLVVALDDGQSSVTPGSTLILRAQVTNGGSQDAMGVVLSIELPAGEEFYSASHGGTLSGASVSFPAVALPVGAAISRAVTVRVPADLQPEVSELAALAQAVDDGANGAEPTPGNNSAIDTDAVGHAPDLAIDTVSAGLASVDPQTLEISGEVQVSWTNRGTLPAGGATLAIFEDLDRSGSFSRSVDRVLGETAVAGMAVGEWFFAAVAVSGTLELRDDRVFAIVDADAVLAEIDEHNNIGDSGASCGAQADLGSMNPAVELSWPPAGGPAFKPLSVDSLSTPLVVQLTDDNGDGRWDEQDVPDMVFVTANLAPTFPPEPDIVLRAIRGDSGAPIWNVSGLFTTPPSFFSMSGLAAGDIDGDGKVEIVTSVVTPDGYGFLHAYEHTGAFKWRSQTYDTHPFGSGTSNRDNPSLADLDGDGDVEILVGAHVFDSAGHRLWVGSGGQAYQTQRNNQLVGGAISVAADVDLDGFQEVVTGNTLYRHDGTIVWQRTEADGYPAVLNADADPQAEIVVVSRGFIRLHDTDGTLLWGPLEMPGSDPESGGPPSVGDLDGDGEPEIVVAGSDILWALHLDGTPLWQASTRDYSSSQTGATLFDFDGDSALEVVYRDERRLRIYRGTDGEVLFEQVLSSTTMVEMPVVADVDGDGNAEIVVTSDHAWDYPVPAGERTGGLVVIGDAWDGWVTARPIWNQHAYTIDSVTASGVIPRRPSWGWLEHRTFRTNVSPRAWDNAGTDVTAGRLIVDTAALPEVRATVRIGNAGTTPIAPGLEVALYDGPRAAENLRATGSVPVALRPGAHFDLTLTFDDPSGFGPILTVLADAAERERECNEGNNEIAGGLEVAELGLWVTLSDGTSGAAPGDLLTYVAAVHNSFAGVASGIALTDTLPQGLLFVAASDGGTELSGVVSWPAFALASGAVTTRNVTVRVDPSVALGVTSLTNRVSVTDDGASGPEPTPANNQATDTDQVLSVVAEAGGPYGGGEGEAIAFDGGASLDRDGGPLAFAWDLDGDGEFDDGSAATASRTFDDEGSFTIRLRVTDDEGEVDFDEAAVTVVNVAPQVTPPAAMPGTEGARVDLSLFRVADPGAFDSGPVTVNWGDGTVESVAVEVGIPTGEHVFREDGEYIVELCAQDEDGGSGCATVLAVIANEAPRVHRSGEFGFAGWQREEMGGGVTSRWSVGSDARSATEELNGEPSFFVGDLPGYGTHELTLRVVDNGDDDFVGVAIGFEAGDTTRATAEYLLIDWKRHDQTGARRGLALSRVIGVPTPTELWVHQDLAGNGAANRVVELQRGLRFGTVGWSRQTEYRLRIEATPAHLRLLVDGRLELDYAGPVPNGDLALYDLSQAGTRFDGGLAESHLLGREGDSPTVRTPFTDAGVLDAHFATISWGNGETTAGTVSEEEGHGDVFGQHAYRDDVEGSIGVCVADDEGDEGCIEIPVTIENVPPALSLVVASPGFVEQPVSLAGSSFTDAGLDDSHVVTVGWGDGTSEVRPVSAGGASGSWVFDGAHLYAAPGTYEIEICVLDDDGGESCEIRSLTLVYRFFDLRLTMTALPVEARPGQNVVFTLRVENAGSLPASGIVLTGALPAGLNYVSTTLGGVRVGSTVTWNLGSLAAGASASPTVTMQVPVGAPFGGSALTSGAVSDNGVSGADANPSNNFSSASVRFSDAITPIVAISPGPAGWTGSEGKTFALSGVTWTDSPSGTHQATVFWGDGSGTPGIVSPSNGTSGSVTGSHVYVQDGVYKVDVCVFDAGSRFGCRSSNVTIGNLPPNLVEPGDVDLRGWMKEEFLVDGVSAVWTVAADGLSVYQSINSQPSVFLSPLPAIGTFLEGTIRVESGGTWDDDFIGFVLGFDVGDSFNPDSDFLVVDWKQQDQSGALRGLAVSRAFGAMGEEFWAHNDMPENGTGNGVTELARALTLGRTGWVENREYHFRFEVAPDRLKIWVDGVQQFDLAVTVPAGKFGFYNFSQEAVRYRGFSSGLQQRSEGEIFDFAAPFADFGILDVHTATVDWDDGESSEANALSTSGFGVVSAAHAFPDDGGFQIEACVEDEAGGTACGAFPVLVLNRPPVVVPATHVTGVAGLEESFALATFTDPGILDSHVASVSWGDGQTEAAAVDEEAGSGTIAAPHRYPADGVYPVEVCVTDDDGASACAALSIAIGSSPPAVRAQKTATVIDRDGDGRASPGDDLLYRIEVFNDGAAPATQVRFTDSVPAHTALVAGSLFPELGWVETDPLTLEINPIDAQSSVVAQFAVTIADPLPAGVAEIVNSGLVSFAEGSPQPTDDPALPGRSDPTRTPVFASPGLSAVKTAAVIDLDGDGVASPGDEIEWTLVVRAGGDSAAGGVLLQDSIGEHLALVPGSLSAPGAHLLSIHPVTAVYDVIPVGGEVALSFRTEIDPALPLGIESVSNQATVLASEVDSFSSDDPATTAAGDPTVVPVYVDPTLTVSSASVLEGNLGSTSIAFPVSLDRPARLVTTVSWTVEGGTAIAGEDFVAASGLLTIPVGASVAEIVVDGIGDFMVENDELLRLVLFAPEHAELAVTEVFATLVNDDAATVSIVDATTDEGGVATFTVLLSAPSSFPITVDFATADGSATSGTDFTAAGGVLEFPPLATAQTVAVPTLDDAMPEPTETFAVALTNAVGATMADGIASGAIVDDDTVELAIAGAAVVEGDTGDVELTLPITLSAPTFGAVEMDVVVTAGSATEGADYSAVGGHLAIPAGETAASVVIVVHGDLADETDETIEVALVNVAGASLGAPIATGTIVDDDEPETTGCLGPNLLVNGGAEARPEACEVPGWVEVAGDAWVRLAEADLPAAEGARYFVLRSGEGDDHHDDDDDDDDFGGGELWTASGRSGGSGGSGGNCEDDDDDGDHEDFGLLGASGDHGGDDDGDGCHGGDDLSAMSGGGHGGDDDACVAELAQTVNVSAFAARIDGGEQAFVFRGALRTELGDAAAKVRVRVEYLPATGSTALEAFDTDWTWSDGLWQIVEDERTAPAGTRRLSVQLFVQGGAEDDDGDLSESHDHGGGHGDDEEEALGFFDAFELRPVDTTVLTARDLFEYEGQSGLHDAWVPLEVSCPSDFAIDLSFSTANGTARAPGDYSSRSGSLSLPPASAGTTVAVPIKGDTVDEADERFELRFTGASLGDAVLFDGVSSITILDDDFCRRSSGYWKTHRSSWAVEQLTLGAEEIDDDEMMSLLGYGGADGAKRLARQLVAARLNLAKGSHPWIVPTAEEADLFLIEFPPGSSPSGEALTQANSLKDQLDSYNNSGCQVP